MLLNYFVIELLQFLLLAGITSAQVTIDCRNKLKLNFIEIEIN